MEEMEAENIMPGVIKMTGRERRDRREDRVVYFKR